MLKQRSVLLVSLIAMFAVTSARADIASTAYVQSLDVSTFDNDAGYLVSADISSVVDAVNAVVDTQDPDSLVNRVTDVETALGASGSANTGKAVIAGNSLGTPTYRAIDTTAGGTTGSNSLITSGAVYSGLSGKQATINDLSDIRNNATAGASASATIATYGNIVTHNTSEFATSTQGGKADSAIQSVKVNGSALTPDSNKAVNVTVPTKVSDLTNDANYITASQVASGQVQADWTEADDSDPAYIKHKPTKVSDFTNDTGFITSSALPTKVSDLTNDTGFVTAADQVQPNWNATSGKGQILNKPTKVSDFTNDTGFVTASDQVQPNWNATSGKGQILNKPTLATVATSGSYTDLSNKPTAVSDFTNDAGYITSAALPTKVSDLTNDTGFVTASDQVQPDWNAVSGKGQILNKPTAVSAFTNDANYLTSHQTLPTVTTSSGSGNVVTNVTQTNGAIAVTKGRVQIPVGNETADTYASIWVE